MRKGVQWSIYCVGSAKAMAHSERFTGTDHWQHFAVQFKIPVENCAVQMLRLELAGRSALDFEAKGAIWFDDLSIARQTYRPIPPVTPDSAPIRQIVARPPSCVYNPPAISNSILHLCRFVGKGTKAIHEIDHRIASSARW